MSDHIQGRFMARHPYIRGCLLGAGAVGIFAYLAQGYAVILLIVSLLLVPFAWGEAAKRRRREQTARDYAESAQTTAGQAASSEIRGVIEE